MLPKGLTFQFHGSPPLSVKHFKFLGDKYIKEQHFTTRDFKEAVRLLFKTILHFGTVRFTIAIVKVADELFCRS